MSHAPGPGWRYLGETVDGGQLWWAPAGEEPPGLDELRAALAEQGRDAPGGAGDE